MQQLIWIFVITLERNLCTGDYLNRIVGLMIKKHRYQKFPSLLRSKPQFWLCTDSLAHSRCPRQIGEKGRLVCDTETSLRMSGDRGSSCLRGVHVRTAVDDLALSVLLCESTA